MGYVLAMYDIRGKQDFIYRRTKVKEIIGASQIIRDCFKDYLYDAAEKVCKEKGASTKTTGICTYKIKEVKEDKCIYEVGEKFSKGEFEKHLGDGYIGEVVYDGGGNFFVLFKDMDSYKATNKIFYRSLLKEIGSLRVLTSYLEIENLDDYKRDEKELRERHRQNEQRECAIHPVNTLPIVQTDYMDSMPLVRRHIENLADDNKVSLESFAKYEKYHEYSQRKSKTNPDVTEFDKMVEKKGVDSHLAVIYIDGNSMGAKVEQTINGKKSYEECINALRDFSASIQENYIDTPIKAIDNYLSSQKVDAKRYVVYAGDEITLICNAKHAFNIVKEYFKALPDGGKGNATSCAGVAIFHSHAPYSDAYRIAEECCESGKQLMKNEKIKNACFMDFQYLQGAVGVSLDEIREKDHVADLCKPWAYRSDKKADFETFEDVEKMETILKIIARGNTKDLLQYAKSNKERYELEIERIIAHCKNEEDKKKLNDDKDFLKEHRELLYRMMLVFDLWFKEEKSDKEAQDD